jgi:hypothetical protein
MFSTSSKTPSGPPEQLDQAIKRKASKHYGESAILLVYLNISSGQLHPNEHDVEFVINQAKVRYASHFEEIIVLWEGKLY